ncbi:MAG: TonB family protein [Alphaproteobacteria bacterium]|nr:TonB family protein [Alphaproteobacteria bacterium]
MLWLSLALAQQLPSLESAVPPVYPQPALEQGRSGSVVLRLSVDEAGAVRFAAVEQSDDPAFDDAALDAARAFRFAPALDQRGEPAPAEILWEMRFEPSLAPPVRIEGTIRTAAVRQPGAGFRVEARSGGVVRYATADGEGRFRFADLDDGAWSVALAEPGYEALEASVEVVPGKVATVAFSPKQTRPWEVQEDFDEVVVVYEREAAVEVSERVLSTEDIYYLPGTAGDVVKAIQNLPGVGRPAFGIGQLLIRGTAPEDSAYYLDGARLPAVFHFAGFSTVLNGDILEDVALLSGNYSARYGRTLGGVVDLRVSEALPERSSGYVSVDLFQATGFVEQRIGENTSLSVSGRRSYVDAVLTPVLSGLGSSAVRAPRYYDFQVRALHHSDQGVVDAMFLLSDDAFRVVGDMDDADEVQIGLNDRFQKARLRWTHDLGSGWRGDVTFLGGPEVRMFDIAPDGKARETTTAVNTRLELTRGYEGTPFAWRTGLDLYTGGFRWEYDVETFGSRTVEKGFAWFTSPSPYIEPSVRFGVFEVTSGLRIDPWILDNGYTAVAVDPRFVGRIRPTDTTTFEAAVGQFSQFPGVRQVIDSQGGSSDLGPQRSIQASVGLEQQLGPFQLEVTMFGSELSNLVSGREDAFRFFTGPPPVGPLDTAPYANDGTGRVVGVESLLQLKSERTLGWLAVTASRSTRVKRPDAKSELFEYDQPLVVTALVSHQLPRRWRIGGRARFGSGNPYTPVVNRYYDLDRREFSPIYGEIDSARLPAFFSLDLRIDKDFQFRKWQLTTYLDVQNATNRQNVDVIGWTDDYSAEDPIAGLPLIPAFGVKGAW